MMDTLVQESTRSRVFWTDEEWQKLTLALIKNPRYQNGFPKVIPTTDLLAAMEVLPNDRRRTLYSNANVKLRPGLNRALAQIRELMTSEPAPEPVARPTKRVYWRDDEYLALARELYRMAPSANYHLSTTLAGLSPPEVREAERNVLPDDRRRRLITIVSIRPPLIEAFKTVRAEVEEAQHRTNEALQQYRQPPPAPEPEPVPEPTPEPVAETVNAHELALKVLCEMLAPALARHLAPELVKLLGAEVVKQMTPLIQAIPSPAAPKTAAPEAEADPLEFGPPPDWTPPAFSLTPAAPRLPTVGILGLRPSQLQELQKAFPNIEFISSQGHHSTKTLNSLQSAVRVVSVNTDVNNMNQLTDKMLAKHFEERYVRANGGLSAVKRQINLWINQGLLK